MPYSAFISYHHDADSRLANALQSALHRFAKPWYKLRALHIFRDQTNLAVNPALWSSIRDALDQSLFLILLASPESAGSPWVAKEAEYWITRNGPSHILIVLTGGALKWDHSTGSFTDGDTSALPGCLLRAFPEEPLFLDLRWARDAESLRLREPRFHEAVLQLAATLHNRPKDELDGADVRARRHTQLIASAGLIALLLVAVFALRQTRVSLEESTQNLAARLAANSAKVLADSPDRVREAALLAIESTRLNPSFEGNQALRSAVSLLPGGSQFYAPPDSNPDERIRDMAFSPDGALLAVARDDGSTQVVDVANHQPVEYFMPDAQPLARVNIPGDGQDAALDNNAAVSVAFNSMGSLLASGARDGVVHIWALPDGREVLRVQQGAPVSQVAFRSGANQVLIAGDDGHVRVFDLARAAIVGDFKCPDKVVAASFSPDSSFVAALSSDGAVSIFDPVRQKLLRTLSGGETAFNLAFSADGKRLATASGDFAFVWDATTGQQLLKATHAPSSETLTPRQWIVDVALSPDGKVLAYAARGDRLARVWNVDTGRQVLELRHSSAVAAVVFNADGTKLGTGSYDGTARVWELPSGSELERASHGGGAEVVSFSPGGNRFAAGGMDGSISVSDTHRADRPASFNLSSDVRAVAFSPDGRRVAIGAVSVHRSPLLRVAEPGGKILRDIEFHGAPVIDKLFFLNSNEVIAQWSSKLFSIAVEQSSVTSLPDIPGDKRIDPSGKLFAVQREGVSKLYALPSLQQTASVTGPNPGPSTGAGPASMLLRAAVEGKLLIFETNKPPNDFFVDIWSVANNARVSRIRLSAELTRLALNLSGTLLFTAQNENLQVWEIPSGKRLFSIVADSDIEQIVPDPSSADFATITRGRLTVWDAVTGARLAQLPEAAGYLRAAAFSPDGRYLLAGYDERAAAIWLWRSSDLRDQACAHLNRNFSHDEWAHWFPKQLYRPACPNLPATN
jgi:WD40 repeat protein